MSPVLSATRLRSLLAGYIAVIALLTIVFALLNARVAHPWIVGEWLINYSGGFVRRGLLGQGLLLTHRVTGLPLVGLTGGLQVLLYAAFYASLLPLLRGVRWSLPLLALLLSPATLAFTVLDPPTSVRKEVLLFLSLSLCIRAVLSRRARQWQVVLALSIVAPLLILTHEALAVFLPYLLLPLLVSVARPRDAIRLAMLPVALTAIALAAIVAHPGGNGAAQAVCASVGGHLPGAATDVCHGAIAYLALTPAQARAETLRAIHFYRYGSRYPFPMLLALLPIVLLFWRRLRVGDPATAKLLLVTLLSLLVSLPLFVIARDWGRWVEIHVTCLLLLFLLLERPRFLAAQDDVAEAETAGLKLPIRKASRSLQLLGLAVYATCWTLPAVGIFPGRFGYLDLLRYLHSYRSRPHLSTGADGTPARSPDAIGHDGP